MNDARITPRLRYLASDENPDADQRGRYRLIVERLVSGGPGKAAPGPREGLSASGPAPGPAGNCGCGGGKKSRPEVVLKMPSAAQQLANLAKATAAYAANGFRTLGEEEAKARLAICEACPFLSADRRCYQCGCWMEVKATWASAYCDDGRWEAVPGPVEEPAASV